MNNKFTTLLAWIMVSLSISILYIFGINSGIPFLHNIGMFTAWFFGILGVFTFFITEKDKAWKDLANRPKWYKVVICIVGFPATIALVGHGLFFLGFLHLISDMRQVYIMSKGST